MTLTYNSIVLKNTEIEDVVVTKSNKAHFSVKYKVIVHMSGSLVCLDSLMAL